MRSPQLGVLLCARGRKCTSSGRVDLIRSHPENRAARHPLEQRSDRRAPPLGALIGTGRDIGVDHGRPRRRFPAGWTPVVALGVVTITAYGSWFYGFGVLVGPIADDTGWSLGALGGVYAASQLVSAVGSALGGRLLDRAGITTVLRLQALLGAPILAVASVAPGFVGFAAAGALGGGVIGALGFYHVTTAAAARIGPSDSARSISVLTMIGAFCSPIYLPITAWLVTSIGWRPTLRLLALSTLLGAVICSLFVRGGASPSSDVERRSARVAIARALPQRRVLLMLIAVCTSWIAYGSVLVLQVPILVAAGLGLTTAASVAGFRGFCQLFGRIGIIGIVNRIGARQALMGAYGFTAAGVVLLLAGGWLPAALVFAVLVGTGVGAVSPLQAIYGTEVFDPDDLGTLMGVQQTVASFAAATGPIAAGLLADATGSLVPAIVLGAATATLALGVLALDRHPAPPPSPGAGE